MNHTATKAYFSKERLANYGSPKSNKEVLPSFSNSLKVSSMSYSKKPRFKFRKNSKTMKSTLETIRHMDLRNCKTTPLEAPKEIYAPVSKRTPAYKCPSPMSDTHMSDTQSSDNRNSDDFELFAPQYPYSPSEAQSVDPFQAWLEQAASDFSSDANSFEDSEETFESDIYVGAKQLYMPFADYTFDSFSHMNINPNSNLPQINHDLKNYSYQRDSGCCSCACHVFDNVNTSF